jgi:hypothetical protein
VENIDKLIALRILFLFRNALRENLSILVKVQDRMITQRFAIETIGTRLVNAYPAALIFAANLGLLDESLDKILDRSCLRYQQIVLVL